MTDKELEQLFDSFASNDISDARQQQLIHELESQPAPEIPAGLEERLAESIDALAAAERTRSTISLPHRRRHHIRVIAGIAASVAVLIALGTHLFTTPSISSSATPLDTCATPEEAYAEAQRALTIFSTALNKGVEQMEMIESTTTEINEKVSRQLRKV